jgi:hypothetical protein
VRGKCEAVFLRELNFPRVRDAGRFNDPLDDAAAASKQQSEQRSSRSNGRIHPSIHPSIHQQQQRRWPLLPLAPPATIATTAHGRQQAANRQQQSSQ